MKYLKITVIGAGRVGSVIIDSLLDKSFEIICVVEKNPITTKSLKKKYPAVKIISDLKHIPAKTKLFIISVQDRFIKDVANQLSLQFKSFSNKFACHTSGCLTSDELTSLQEKDCEVFSFHPNVSITFSKGKNSFSISHLKETIFTIESNSQKALNFAKKFSKAVGWKSIVIKPELKPLYHAFSVMISNYTVTLINEIKNTLGEEFIDSYLQLLNSTIQNIKYFGVENALTGPAIRGDFKTIKSNLKALSEIDKNLLEIYNHYLRLTEKFITQIKQDY